MNKDACEIYCYDEEKVNRKQGELEKEDITGNVSYDPENHQHMVKLREEKINLIAHHIPLQTIDSGPENGDLLVLGWGSTYGAIKSAVRYLQAQGKS